MPEWIAPVYDRTEEDVEYAKRNMLDDGGYEKAYFTTNDGFYFTDAAYRHILFLVVSEHKGAYNASDLNRVNGNMLFLKDVLADNGITVELKTASRVWQMMDIPTAADFESYLNDVSAIRNAVTQMSDTPHVPSKDKFDYLKANDIEKILYDTYRLVYRVRDSFYYSGEIYAGEVS